MNDQNATSPAKDGGPDADLLAKADQMFNATKRYLDTANDDRTDGMLVSALNALGEYDQARQRAREMHVIGDPEHTAFVSQSSDETPNTVSATFLERTRDE